jgi:acyl-CoA synthetase (NDP forming)
VSAAAHNGLPVDAIFEARSVAVYGASRDERKLGHTLLRNVLTGGFEGHVVAVNPAGGEILGVEAVPALKEPVDLALISVPAAAAEAVLMDAARAGCRAAIVLASGFGETGAEGRVAEARLARIANAAGMRLVGPNCMGVVSRQPSGWLNGSYFWRLPDLAGGVSMISQSGAFGGMFFAEARKRRLGLARFLSVGNSVDVTETDALEWLGNDPSTEVIGLFVEAFREGRRFVEVAESCRQPVVVLKAGKGGAGTRAAASHTGSLAGRHATVQAAFARAGVIEAATSDEFFDLLRALADGGPATGRRVAILTISGGPGVLASDAAERHGLCLPSPSTATAVRVRQLAPSFAAVANPIDLTPQCPPASFPVAIRAVFEDPVYDGVIVINCGLDVPEFGQGVAEASRRTRKPVTAFVLEAPSIEAELAAARIPLLPSPERAVAAYAAMVARR